MGLMPEIPCGTAMLAAAGNFTISNTHGRLCGFSVVASAAVRIRLRETNVTGRILAVGGLAAAGSIHEWAPSRPFNNGIYLELIAGAVEHVVIYYI